MAKHIVFSFLVNRGLSKGLWVCRCNSSWTMKLRLGAKPAGAALCHIFINPTVSHTVPISPLPYHVSPPPHCVSPLPYIMSHQHFIVFHHQVVLIITQLSLTVCHHSSQCFTNPSLCFTITSLCHTIPHCVTPSLTVLSQSLPLPDCVPLCPTIAALGFLYL